MLKNITPRERKTIVEHYIDFDFDDNGGFSFPCDPAGALYELPPEAKNNYDWCMAHPEKFERWNKHTEIRRSYTENASGDCICGNRVELYDQYMGACECQNCGRWYNLFGQELLPPEHWED